MQKRHFSLLILAVLLITSCGPQKDSKPNILFLFTDDQTHTAISALGNAEIYTPNIDRLVERGTTFANTYNMGGWNGAICTASRSMLISGRSLWRANEYRKHWQKGDSIENTWGRIMAANGYQTFMTGKWHVDAPADSVFGFAAHIRPGMPRDARLTWKEEKDNYPDREFPIGYNRPLSESDTSWSPIDPKFGGFWEGGKHWSEVVRDDALLFLDSAQKSTDPFFMYIAFNAPHDPRQAPQEYQDMYDLDNITLPESFKPLPEYQEEIGNGPGLRDEALAPFPRTEYAVKVHMKEYYAIISHLDAQIGKILDALEASGKADNTYIFFTSDHGLAVGRHGFIGKQNPYEHSVKPPLILVGPGIPANQKVNSLAYLQDLMPTALDLAGIAKPGYVEFQSLMPLVKGEKPENYPSIYNAYINYQRLIRKGDYKLIVYPKVDKVMLFNLAEDPLELNDLASQPDYKEKVDELLSELKQKMEHYDDPLELNL
tara:strand:+ start:2959 stop:4419 length:1461 start_codon:yes stop_codon:yes gene_type:complete